MRFSTQYFYRYRTVFAFCLLVCLKIAIADEGTQVVLLGTGTPNPDPQRSGPSVAIVVDDQAYLVDFGPGVVRRASSMSPRYGGEFDALDVSKLNRAFVTHLHSDHTTGFADLILTPWVEERETPLVVYGPEGIANMAEHLLKAYQADIHYRLYSNQPANNEGWRVEAHEIQEDGEVYKDDKVVVEAFRVKHGNWPNAYAYRFTTPDRVIVVSGDAALDKSIEKYARDADILVHEVFVEKGLLENRTPKWQAYHRNNHTSAIELGQLAQRAGVKTLVLYHILFFGSNQKQLVAEIRQNFKGEIVVGNDLEVVE